MAGRIIFTSPLATQSDIHKFYQANMTKCSVILQHYVKLFRAKMAGYLKSFQDKVIQGL